MGDPPQRSQVARIGGGPVRPGNHAREPKLDVHQIAARRIDGIANVAHSRLKAKRERRLDLCRIVKPTMLMIMRPRPKRGSRLRSCPQKVQGEMSGIGRDFNFDPIDAAG